MPHATTVSPNIPSGHLGEWTTLWWADKMLDGQHQRVDVPSALCQNCWQWPPAEKTDWGSLLNHGIPPDDPVGQRTELNWVPLTSETPLTFDVTGGAIGLLMSLHKDKPSQSTKYPRGTVTGHRGQPPCDKASIVTRLTDRREIKHVLQIAVKSQRRQNRHGLLSLVYLPCLTTRRLGGGTGMS